jgi:hypothetical protein
MLKGAMKWHVRPEMFLRTNTRNKNYVVVFAASAPKQNCIQYGDSNDWLLITD